MKKAVLFFMVVSGLFSALTAATLTVCPVIGAGCTYDSVKLAVAAAVDGDEITVAAGVYTEYSIIIDKSLTVTGADRDTTIIQASTSENSGTSYGVFRLTGSSNTVTLNSLTIRHGYSSSSGNYYGGGIYNNGDLTVNDCMITANRSHYSGGGIYSGTGTTLTLTNSTVMGNRAPSSYGGGGLYINGVANIEDTTISGNSAVYGGGIIAYNYADITVRRTTISGNTVTSSDGGGINISMGSIALFNSTISNNFAYDSDSDGGGIFTTNNANVMLNNSTVSGNFAANRGGGIFNTSGSRVEMKNTIVADNHVGSVSNDCYGVLDSYGYNLISNLTYCAIGTDNSNNILGLDARLNPLATNGGPTATQSIEDSSPAVDGGSCTDLDGSPITQDQRGIGRPHGDTCDIGAYEYNGEIPVKKFACWDQNENSICDIGTEDFNGDGDCTPTDCKGEDGMNCWDLNLDGSCDIATEDQSGDGQCTILDCRGTTGNQGYACWDVNTNHVCDSAEDIDSSGFCNIDDCRGVNGYNCWDLDQDYLCDPIENKNGDADCSVLDCQGSQGDQGLTCWDMNGNGSCDIASEDLNTDGLCNLIDCRGSEGVAGYSCWDLNVNHICDPSEDRNSDLLCNVLDCQGADGADGSDGENGADGSNGADGADGADGYSCWDLDDDYICDPSEDKNGDDVCTTADCKGDRGISCWDINSNNVCDHATEDYDEDGDCDVQDCKGSSNGYSCWDLNMNHICDGSEDVNGDINCTVSDCRGADGEDGKNALVKVTDEPAGVNCASGGKKVESGIDLDNNTVLTENEIQNTEYICNGDDGTDGVDGTDGTNGEDGADGSNGIDGNDGTKGETGDAGDAGGDGESGTNSLVEVNNEEPGSNCATGGKRIDSGVDADDSGKLSESEIKDTSYVCNGVDGEAGVNGAKGGGCSIVTTNENGGNALAFLLLMGLLALLVFRRRLD